MWACWLLMVAAWGFMLYPKVFGECGWFTPKLVMYHDGMTLCPGQSAQMQINIPTHSGSGGGAGGKVETF